jgi:TolA-binding protein
MKMKILFQYGWVVLLVFSSPNFVYTQSVTAGGDEYQSALREYVEEQLIRFGVDAIRKERFLVQQMRMLNDEIKSRVANVVEIKNQYFAGLEARLQEIQSLKKRLNKSGNKSLQNFITELERRIHQTLNEGRIDFQRQKVFEDGIQLLYIAEEMMDLNPNVRLDQDPKISAQMADSRKNFVNTFGGKEYVSGQAATGSSQQINIFDIFKEWRNTYIIKYETRWTDVQIIKNRLIRDGSPAENEHMFKRELRDAILTYNFGNFDLADRLFEEILVRFNFISDLDDVYFYRGEANYNLGRYHQAEELYLELVQKYSASLFAAQAYHKLIKIAYHFKDPVNVDAYYKEFSRLASASDPLYNEARFIYGLSALENTHYETVVQVLTPIPPQSSFYHEAQYLLARAYCGAHNLEEAERILKGLIKGTHLEPNFRFIVLLKLGYIKYEQGDYLQAVKYFDQIAGTFPLYDRVLIGYAWVFYRQELAQPYDMDKPRSFPFSKKYLKMLVNNYPVSEYVLEAKSLLGYIYQLEMKPEAATDQYNYTYRTRYPKELSDRINSERDSLKQIMDVAKNDAREALVKNDPSAFYAAENANDQLLDSYMVNYSDVSSTSVARRSEIARIGEQLEELDLLREIALERNNQALIERIDQLQEKLQSVLKETSPEEMQGASTEVNSFAVYPSARRESMIEDNNRKVLAMRESAQTEHAYLNKRLNDIAAEITRARAEKDINKIIQLELEYNTLKEIYNKYDYLDTYAHSLALRESNINLEKWSDYGAFGIANVNFEIKRTKSERMSYYAAQVQKINEVLNSRKNILEYKIAQIEGEINLMTRRVRRQEREREREELNRRFEESYFDTHTTEFENTNMEPPSFDDEPKQEE